MLEENIARRYVARFVFLSIVFVGSAVFVGFLALPLTVVVIVVLALIIYLRITKFETKQTNQ